VDIEHSGELGFLEDRLAIPGLEGPVLVPVSMPLSRVGSLVGIGSSLLEPNFASWQQLRVFLVMFELS